MTDTLQPVIGLWIFLRIWVLNELAKFEPKKERIKHRRKYEIIHKRILMMDLHIEDSYFYG